MMRPVSNEKGSDGLSAGAKDKPDKRQPTQRDDVVVSATPAQQRISKLPRLQNGYASV
jgi:hypothetical protein